MNEMYLDFAATAKPFASVVLCITGVTQEERVLMTGEPANLAVSDGESSTTNGSAV
jgi:hypothetical protein